MRRSLEKDVVVSVPMTNPSPQTWLELSDGTRLDVTPRGLIVGRGAGAEVQLPDVDAPRRQALLFVDSAGPCLVPLGLEPIRVNGSPRDLDGGPVRLQGGDRIDFGCLAGRVGIRVEGREGPSGWILRHGRTSFQEVPWSGFRVGGGAGDDLRILGWPTGALQLDFEDETLRVRGVAGMTMNGEPVEPGEPQELASGDRLGWGSETVQVLELNPGIRGGRTERVAMAPSQIALQPVPPAGGQVTVSTDGEETTVFLPDRLFRFLLLLLQPPEGFRPGAEIPDSLVLSRLWGAEVPMDGQAVTDLATEVQQGLSRGGIDGAALLERGRQRSRVRLAEGTSVVVLRPR